MRHKFYFPFTCFVFFVLSSCSSGLLNSGTPVSLQEIWTTDNMLRTPESVLFDRQRNVLYVSNMNQASPTRKDGDGFISILTPGGAIENLHWVTGLNDPKGMALFNNVLYVTDLDEIVAIATQTGSVLGRYKAEKAQFLNDVTVDSDGNIYASDSDKNRIYILRNGRVSTLIEDTKKDNRPNGLLYDNTRLIIAFSGSGNVRFYDLERREFTDWVDGIPSADGIARAADMGHFVSSWQGEVYFVSPEGKKLKVLDTKNRKINAADITINEEQMILYVPTFYDNRVVAYKITGTGI